MNSQISPECHIALLSVILDMYLIQFHTYNDYGRNSLKDKIHAILNKIASTDHPESSNLIDRYLDLYNRLDSS